MEPTALGSGVAVRMAAEAQIKADSRRVQYSWLVSSKAAFSFAGTTLNTFQTSSAYLHFALL